MNDQMYRQAVSNACIIKNDNRDGSNSIDGIFKNNQYGFHHIVLFTIVTILVYCLEKVEMDLSH